MSSDTSGSLSRGKNIGGNTDGPPILLLEIPQGDPRGSLECKAKKGFRALCTLNSGEGRIDAIYRMALQGSTGSQTLERKQVDLQVASPARSFCQPTSGRRSMEVDDGEADGH